MNEKNLYIIAGCNGACKTTASFTILPDMLDCKEFVNADEIAKGLSPFQPEKVPIEAGRIMLNRISELLNGNQSFAFETTLSTKSYKNKIIEAKEKGFTVILLFFWLETIELAKERVRTRVEEGGHTIETDVITRRYKRGISNLFDIYLDATDAVMIWDNSTDVPVLIAEKTDDNQIQLINKASFSILRNQYNEYKLILSIKHHFLRSKNNVKNTGKHIEYREKILLAMRKVHDKLIEFKKSKDSSLVILRDGKIVCIKP